jgi:hypothetical protein
VAASWANAPPIWPPPINAIFFLSMISSRQKVTDCS